jgi:hypothetical protein
MKLAEGQENVKAPGRGSPPYKGGVDDAFFAADGVVLLKIAIDQFCPDPRTRNVAEKDGQKTTVRHPSFVRRGALWR